MSENWTAQEERDLRSALEQITQLPAQGIAYDGRGVKAHPDLYAEVKRLAHDARATMALIGRDNDRAFERFKVHLVNMALLGFDGWINELASVPTRAPTA